MKKISTPSQMKPKSEGEISQFKKVSPEGKINQYSVYLLDGQFHLVHGLIFHVRQNHTVAKSNKNFATIAKAII